MEADGLVSALRDIHIGKTVVAPPLTSVLLRFVKGDMTVSQSKGPFSELTPREGEILELMAEGQGNKLIARGPTISSVIPETPNVSKMKTHSIPRLPGPIRGPIRESLIRGQTL